MTWAGNYLRELRESRGLTTRDLGQMAGYSGSYISQMETGERRLSIERMWFFVQMLDGNIADALNHLARDAGVPEEALNAATDS